MIDLPCLFSSPASTLARRTDTLLCEVQSYATIERRGFSARLLRRNGMQALVPQTFMPQE